MLFLLFMSASQSCWAAVELFSLQVEQPPLTATLQISGETLNYGEDGQPLLTEVDQLRCLLQVTSPEDARLIIVLPPNEYGDFSLLEKETGQRHLTDQGLVSTLSWLIEPHKVGESRLPDMTIRAELADGSHRQLLLPGRDVVVSRVVASNEADILPPIVREPPPPRDWRSLAIAVVSLSLVVVVWWLICRRPDPVPPSPHELAMAKLVQLQSCATPSATEAEILSLLLRRFVDSCCMLHTSGQTLAEIGPALQRSNLSAAQQHDLLTMLAQCEQWQFQPGTVAVNEFTAVLEQARQFLVLPADTGQDDKTCGRW